MGYVFVSYSSKNQEQADKLCSMFSAKGIDYWLATEHIQGGENYAKVIPSAIKNCACVVLLLSEASQQSVYVSNEIDRAINARKPVFPLRVEECDLSDEFDFYLCRCQIVDARPMDNTPTMEQVFESIKVLTNVGKFLLELPPATRQDSDLDQKEIDAISKLFEEYKIPCKYANKKFLGRQIARYYFTQTEEIDKPNKLQYLMNDLQIHLRVEEKPTVSFELENGIVYVAVEVPRRDRQLVLFEEVFDKLTAQNQGKLAFPLGVDFENKIRFADVTKEHCIFIAGATGTGKTHVVNNMITSLALTHSPQEVQFVLFDPKMVELSDFENLPHLYKNIITSHQDAFDTFKEILSLVRSRYSLFRKYGKRNIDEYNGVSNKKLPHIVVVIDELSYYMMTNEQATTRFITSISKQSLSAGVHIVVTSQHHNFLEKDGFLSMCFSSRIVLKMVNLVDSRSILGDDDGAKLTGKGDLCFVSNSSAALVRLQAPMISYQTLRKLINEIQ